MPRGGSPAEHLRSPASSASFVLPPSPVPACKRRTVRLFRGRSCWPAGFRLAESHERFRSFLCKPRDPRRLVQDALGKQQTPCTRGAIAESQLDSCRRPAPGERNDRRRQSSNLRRMGLAVAFRGSARAGPGRRRGCEFDQRRHEHRLGFVRFFPIPCSLFSQF